MNHGRGTTATTTTRPRKASLWRRTDFMKLWTGETVSQLGTQITLVAYPLTAILVLRAGPFQVGLLTTLEFLPFILFGLPAGVWVDRLPRRPVLIAGDVLRFASLGSIPLGKALGFLSIEQMYAVAFVTGIGTVFFDVAYQAYLPSLVERDQLVDGNAKLEISRSTAMLGGPAVGGFLVQLVTAPIAILSDAISYLWSAAFITWIRKPEPLIQIPEDGHPRMRTEIRDGLRYVWRHPLLRPIALCTGTSNLFGNMAMAIIAVFMVRTLGFKPGEIGLVFALGSVGGLVGATLVRPAAEHLGLGPAIIASITVSEVGAFLMPLATHSIGFAMLIAATFLVGFGGVVYNSNQVGLRQAITPMRMQGKMNATMRFMVWGTIPIGAFIGGVLGGTLGLRPTLWISAVGGVLAVLPPLLSPVRSLERIPEAEPDGPLEALEAERGALGAERVAAPGPPERL